tara:strand:- start:413 stop:766 length:354 start_codon:yes stop_codon:yes gene_type:complete
VSEKPVTHTNGSDDGSTPLARMLFGWTSAKWAPMAMFIVVGLIALGLLVADFMIERHAYKPVTFSLFPMFYGLYGFSAFAFVVVCGWPLGKLLRRDENFYEDQDIDGSDASDDEEGA